MPAKTVLSGQPENPPVDREIPASRVFTPATPVTESTLFAGRMTELRRVIDTINQEHIL
jgi:hypothetical protein